MGKQIEYMNKRIKIIQPTTARENITTVKYVCIFYGISFAMASVWFIEDDCEGLPPISSWQEISSNKDLYWDDMPNTQSES